MSSTPANEHEALKSVKVVPDHQNAQVVNSNSEMNKTESGLVPGKVKVEPVLNKDPLVKPEHIQMANSEVHKVELPYMNSELENVELKKQPFTHENPVIETEAALTSNSEIEKTQVAVNLPIGDGVKDSQDDTKEEVEEHTSKEVVKDTKSLDKEDKKRGTEAKVAPSNQRGANDDKVAHIAGEAGADPNA